MEGAIPVAGASGSPVTRILCIYDLAPRIWVRESSLTSLGAVFDYGRFQRHVDAAARLLPQVMHHATLDPGALRVAADHPVDQHLGAATVVALTTPRGDPLLLLEVELPGEPGATAVASFLAATCHQRERLAVAGQPILRWLSEHLRLPASLWFDRHVHQCVFPAGQLRDHLLRTAATGQGQLLPAVTSIVYRGTVSPERGSRLGIRTPDALNNPGGTVVAHDRGVSLIAGWSEPVENIFALAATTIVAALGVLHRARELAFDALTLSQTSQPASTHDARELVSRLSGRLNEVQLDLSFGVEAYVDTVLIPEEILDSFQASMRSAADLDVGLANTSRMVDRLATVIHTRAAVLDAATQDERERRGRVLNVILAIGSLIALPPSLLLAYFGVASRDIDPSVSMLDLDRYWLAYGLAWLPFAALVLAGFILRRRIRASSRLVGVEQDIDPGDRLVIPELRATPAPRAEPDPDPAATTTQGTTR